MLNYCMLAMREQPSELASAWRFVRIRSCGHGATSDVWEAVDRKTGQKVALKVGRAAGAATVLSAEAERLSMAVSPFVPDLVDLGWVLEAGNDQPYLALTWTSGEPLNELLVETREEQRTVALAVARDIGTALADLHAGGVAHGDVKPANILLERIAAPTSDTPGAWRARLVDLGLSTDVREAGIRGATPRYLAPEIWTHAGEGDPRSRDRFALGLVLAEILVPELRQGDHLAERARAAALIPPFDDLCLALLSPEPGARPRAGWVAARARIETGATENAEERLGRRQRAIRSSYLASRRREVAAAARANRWEVSTSGEPGTWLRNACSLARRACAMRSEPCDGVERLLSEADGPARSRWLVGLVGAEAAYWPVATLVRGTDAEWAQALLQLAEKADPGAFALRSVQEAIDRVRASERPRPDSSPDLAPHVLAPPEPTASVQARDSPAELPSAVELALALRDQETSRAAVETIELHRDLPPALLRCAADQLRRMGETGRAWALIARDDDPVAASLRAEIARRAGDTAEAERQARAALAHLPDDGRAHAVLARLSLDRGDPSGALAELASVPPTFQTMEAKVLARAAAGQTADIEADLLLAEGLATTEEARARIACVVALVAHQLGQTARALEASGRAARHAAHAGALVEEASYLNMEAAAAADEGQIERALSAARRAVLLWDHLGRPRYAARASLAQAGAFSAAGAVLEAKSAATEARDRARQLGDARAEAYALWAITDVLSAGDPEACQAAQAAAALLQGIGLEEDRLRAAARQLRHSPTQVDQATLTWGDELASRKGVLVAARLEWWGARAEVSLSGHGSGRRELPVVEICQLVGLPAPVYTRGPAFAAAAALAARTADGNAVRLLSQAQADAARELLSQVPVDLQESARNLAWVRSVRGAEAPEVSAEQIAQFELLVRALSGRDRLRPLLDQVLDALLLWTGVERGLLLLPAPNGKWVPRSARNLARDDLRGDQLVLSQSLARRAIELREPVVAVDAAGDMPSLHASVHALKLRSVLAIPLVAKSDVVGVVYLDDRIRRGAFGPKELSWVRLVASLAAIAIADARDQLLLRRAVRKAERARQSLRRELDRREIELDQVGRELARTREGGGTRFRYDALVGRSAPMERMLRLVDRVTLSEVPVLITGESGSGKELVARAIHGNGPRGTRLFVSENCSAIPEPLLESTLFGHVRGAFTGADRTRSGLFEIAHKGTLFLDEIGEMSLAMQSKLLRVLQEGEVRPLGAERGRKVDVRIITATHRDLAERVKAGAFREDLLYRLNVISVCVPSLRERPDDIPMLVQHFIEKHGTGRKVRVSSEAMQKLKSHEWPGNVRQLENEVRRALVLCDNSIDTCHLSSDIGPIGADPASELGLRVRDRVDALEKHLVETALSDTNGNQTKAADLLGLSRFGLQKMMKRLGIKTGER